MKANSVAKNTAWITIFQVINYVFPLVLLPYLWRQFDSNIFVHYTVGMGLSQFFIMISDFGYSVYFTGCIAVVKDENDYLRIMKIALQLKIFILFIMMFFFLLTCWLVLRDFSYFSLFGIYVCSSSLMPIWYFFGVQRMEIVVLTNFILRLIAITGIIFLLDGLENVFVIPLSYAFAGIGACVVLWYKVLKGSRGSLGMFRINLKELKIYLRELATYFAARVATASYTSLNTIAAGSLLDVHQAALFTAAERVYMGANSILQPLSLSLYPKLKSASKLSVNRFKQIAIWYSGVIGIYVICLQLFAGWTLDIVYSNYNVGLVNVYRVLIWSILFSGLSFLLGYPAGALLGYEQKVNWTNIYAGLLSIVLLCIGAFTFLDSCRLVSIIFCTELLLCLQRLILFLRRMKY